MDGDVAGLNVSSSSDGTLNASSDSSSGSEILQILADSTSDDLEEDFSDEEREHDILWPMFGILLHGRLKQRVENFIEVARAKSDAEFREDFRVTRDVFNVLLRSLERSGQIPNHVGGREKKSAELSLLMTLWFLANKSVHRTVSNLFHMSYSSVHRIVRRVLDWLMDLMPQVIVWPRGNAIEQISQGFEDKAGISKCIGAIDGSHIYIQAPQHNSREYFNRKQSYSIVLQAVVDSDRKFTNVYCGDPGSFHDVRILRRSELFNEAERNVHAVFPNGTFLLGDKGYIGVGQRWIVTPFREHENLSREQVDFNNRVSATRVTVEQVFGILKNRFRKLKMLDLRDMDCMVRIVLSCCVLHNICVSEGDIGDDFHGDGDDNDDVDGNDDSDGGSDNESDANSVDEADDENGVIENMQLRIFSAMYPEAAPPQRPGRVRRPQ